MAEAVGERTGQAVIAARARHSARPESKTGEAARDLSSEFGLPEEAMFQRLVIIDDVYRSGGTMRGMVAAARRAQSGAVHALVAARTLRN